MPNNAKLVGLEWVWGLLNLASSGEPPLHKTTLTTALALYKFTYLLTCLSKRKHGSFKW